MGIMSKESQEKNESMTAPTEEPVDTTAEIDSEDSPEAETSPKKSRLVARLVLAGAFVGKGAHGKRALTFLLAIIVFAGLTAVMGLWAPQRLSEAEAEDAAAVEDQETPAPSAAPDPSAAETLSARELIGLAESALADGAPEQAQEFLDQARVRADTNSVTLQRDLYLTLAETAERLGHKLQASIHRDYVRRLEASIGASIPIFRQAEEAMQGGRLAEARALCYRFLLRQGDLKLEKDVWIRRCRATLAKVEELAFAATPGPRRELRDEIGGLFQ